MKPSYEDVKNEEVLTVMCDYLASRYYSEKTLEKRLQVMEKRIKPIEQPELKRESERKGEQ